MNHDDPPQRHPAHGDDATGAITTSRQWHDAELAMKVARHSFESWLIAGHEDTPSRAITTLIETFRVEAAALITSPAHGTDIPAWRW